MAITTAAGYETEQERGDRLKRCVYASLHTSSNLGKLLDKRLAAVM